MANNNPRPPATFIQAPRCRDVFTSKMPVSHKPLRFIQRLDRRTFRRHTYVILKRRPISQVGSTSRLSAKAAMRPADDQTKHASKRIMERINNLTAD